MVLVKGEVEEGRGKGINWWRNRVRFKIMCSCGGEVWEQRRSSSLAAMDVTVANEILERSESRERSCWRGEQNCQP